MRDEDLSFNKKYHLLYTKEAKQIVREYINSRYNEKDSYMIWENVQRIYVSFLSDQPPIGPGKNGQKQSVYDCILLFAFYEALPQKPSLDEFGDICERFFCQSYEKIKMIDLNKKWAFRAAKLIFKYTAFQTRHKKKEFPANYTMEMEKSADDEVRYKFYSCPIADFAKRHGYEFLMPAMCNPDYPMLKLIHAGLIRSCTMAKDGNYCDYLITGDKNPILKEHPIKKDERGYYYNE